MRVKIGCLLLLVLTTMGCSKKQEVVYEVDGVRVKNQYISAEMEIHKECRAFNELNKELKAYLNDGWKVVTSSRKERLVYNNMGTCLGTEYVLEK